MVSALLIAGCSSREPTPPGDSDGDGIPDAQETVPHAISIIDKTGAHVTRLVTSDPSKADTDGDGLTDEQELRMGTDPSNADTTGSGLLDGHNITLVPDSPLAIKWRAQGIFEEPRGKFWGKLDQCPARDGLNPLAYSTIWAFGETLSDGDMLRGWNVTTHGRTYHVVADPCSPDPDRDGLTNGREKSLGTDPNVKDTDSDGVPDGLDGDPLHDLGLRFDTIVVNASAGRGADPRVRAAAGELSSTVHLSGASNLSLDVNDASPSGDSLPIPVILSVTNATDAPLRVFPDGTGGLIITFDVLKSTAATSDGPLVGTTLHFAGPDGTITFSWSVSRA